MIVQPLYSTKTGKAVKNQYVIITKDYTVFQSYNSIIVVKNNNTNELTFGHDWDYSVTTLKYLNQFLQNYCYKTYLDFPAAKSLKERIIKAINLGLVKYDTDLGVNI